jgi:rubrerythrin
MPEQLVGASVWEQTLYEHLTTHEDSERELLVEYQQAAAESQSPAFRYLAALIVEDEMRHHRLFRELAESLKTDAEMRPGEPVVPRLGGWGPDPHKVTEISDRLVRHEEMDLEVLRHIRKELDTVKETTLWALLVKLMELDTLKHVEILNFVRRHSKKALP